MISNILIGLGIFACGLIGGFFTGSLMTTNMITKVDKLYEKETGNSFVKWMFDKSANIKKHRIDTLYAAE